MLFRPKSSFVACTAGLLLSAGTAVAGPGLTLDKGRINIATSIEVNMSADAVAKPFSLAPDVSYGVTTKLTLSLIHSTFGTTGFRGNAGRGLCLAGEDKGCAKVYNNVGVEGLMSLAEGPLAVAANVGVHAVSIDGSVFSAKAGIKLRYNARRLVFTSAPAMLIGLTEREVNKESIWIPIMAQYKVSPVVAVGLGSGLKGPLDGLGDNWEVSLGLSGAYTISPTMNAGASWVFGKIAGGSDATGIDYRALHLWYGITL